MITKLDIFKPRATPLPPEYPDVLKFRNAIKHSRWDVEEFNLESDAFEFNNKLTKAEKEAIKRTLLAISTIEVKVKPFWGKLGDHFPKNEFSSVGATFAENEVVHFEAYSELLRVLGLEKSFDDILSIPVISGRVEYLTKYLNNSGDNAKQSFTLKLALFTIFIEDASLFSQFAIGKSLTKKKNLLKEINTIFEATMKEELIHAQFGIHCINIIKQENPEWFNDDFYQKIYRAAKKAYQAEEQIIDWIFEEGEIETISKDSLKEFVKSRLNGSIQQIGGEKVFTIDEEKLKPLYWMIEAIYTYVRNDFFSTQGTNYTKFNKSITKKDLF